MLDTMFSGEYEHRIDPQGRVSIPSRFRESFKGGAILTRGYDRCIAVFTSREWSKMTDRIAKLPITQNKSRKMIRMTFSGAFPMDSDRQGRLLLPLPLRQYAQLEDQVVLVGAGKCMEIWCKELWTQERALLDETAWEIAESMEDRG